MLAFICMWTMLPIVHTEIQFTILESAIQRGDANTVGACLLRLSDPKCHRRVGELIAPQLRHVPDDIQWQLIHTIATLPPEVGKAAVEDLIRIASDTKAANRSTAIMCLGCIGSHAKAAAKTLTMCINDDGESRSLRCQTCVALWRIEGKPNTITPVLNDLLQSQGADTRLAAIKAVSQIGEGLKNSEIDRTILNLVTDDSDRVRKAVYPLVPVFAKTKSAAVELLTWSLLESSEKYDVAIIRLRDGELELASFARERRSMGDEIAAAGTALASLKETAVPGLIRILRLRDHTTARIKALEILASLGQKAADATALVKELTNDPDKSIQMAAKQALKAITEK